MSYSVVLLSSKKAFVEHVEEQKVKPVDTLRTVLLATSCNCKVFIYIYISFFDTTFCKISYVRMVLYNLLLRTK